MFVCLERMDMSNPRKLLPIEALTLYRQVATEASDTEAQKFNALSPDDRLELLFHMVGANTMTNFQMIKALGIELDGIMFASEVAEHIKKRQN